MEKNVTENRANLALKVQAATGLRGSPPPPNMVPENFYFLLIFSNPGKALQVSFYKLLCFFVHVNLWDN